SHVPFGPERLAEIGSLAVQNPLAVNHDYIARRYSCFDYYSGNRNVRRSSAEHTYGRVTPLLSNHLQRAYQTSADNPPTALTSITGNPASGPISPSPSTRVPSVTIATLFDLLV